MFCAYPRCFHLASVRCPTCGRKYCEDHCADWVAQRPGEFLQECDLCKQNLTPVRERANPPPGPVTVIGALGLFLLTIGIGTAIDVSARGNGFIILWIFALAFFAFASCV